MREEDLRDLGRAMATLSVPLLTTAKIFRAGPARRRTAQNITAAASRSTRSAVGRARTWAGSRVSVGMYIWLLAKLSAHESLLIGRSWLGHALSTMPRPAPVDA